MSTSSSVPAAVAETQAETIARLEREVARLRDGASEFYASKNCAKDFASGGGGHIPRHGISASQCKERLVQIHELDNRPRLNTSSYVNVCFEDEEERVALMGLTVNIADGSVYPSSVRLHDNVVDAIAKLWNCPPPAPTPFPSDSEIGVGTGVPVPVHYSGAGTVGSTEACLLALLAHKFRWRAWYAQKYGKTPDEMVGVIPNLIVSTAYQACWEKAFRYFDVKPKFVQPTFRKFKIDAEDIRDLIDEKTIMVVGILGNHYNGSYDPIWDIDKVVSEVNKEKGYQVGIHVDGASGGFIAPFQDNLPPFDFRLDNVLSMSASGHKFGESACGTGWVIFRHRKDLSEHIEVEVTYLGGVSYSMTLNFSRPATGVYIQAYKFLRMGMLGYKSKVENQLNATAQFREKMRALKWRNGQPLYEICDSDDEPGLPVFAARLNPTLDLKFTDFTLQHMVGEYHWYVSAYHLSFEDFSKGGASGPLCKDEPPTSSMFRVVFKSNLTPDMADDLFSRLEEISTFFLKESAEKALGTVRQAFLEMYKETKRASKGHDWHTNVHTAC